MFTWLLSIIIYRTRTRFVRFTLYASSIRSCTRQMPKFRIKKKVHGRKRCNRCGEATVESGEMIGDIYERNRGDVKKRKKERKKKKGRDRGWERERERGRREYVKESAKPSYSVSARAGIERREKEKERKIESIEWSLRAASVDPLLCALGFFSVGGPGASRPPAAVHLGIVPAIDHRPRWRLLRALRGQGARGGGLLRLPWRVRCGDDGGPLLAWLGRQPPRPGWRPGAVCRSQQRHHEAFATLGMKYRADFIERAAIS